MSKRLHVIRENPPPTDAGGALYVAPAPGREGRLCSNCALWQPPERCVIHEPDVVVVATMVCGYHVFGRPIHRGRETIVVEEFVTPATSGLVEAPPGGTRCGNCDYFEHGYCLRVASKVVSENEWQPAQVDRDGCCAQWDGTVRSPDA